MSSDLTWGNHHDLIIRRAYKLLAIPQRTYQNVSSVAGKKMLYLSMVHSQLMYCSPIWRLNLIKDILKFEKVQRHATKGLYFRLFLKRLRSLNLLPLMYQFEINGIMFCIKSLKSLSEQFSLN